MTIPRKEHRDYVHEIRSLLPAEALQARPGKLWAIAAHSVILAAGILAIRYSPSPWLLPLVSLVMAHSMGCLGFIVHDIGHNSVVRKQPFKYLSELYVWGLVMMSPHLWHRVHNQTHHRRPNTLGDTDRRYLKSEDHFTVRWYDRIFVPSKASGKINLTALAFFAYIVRNIIPALAYSGDHKPSFATAKPDYSGRDRARVFLEIGLALALHVGIFFAAGATWVHYLWAGFLPALGGSMILSAYTITNHLLNPLMEEPVDPLYVTTSVEVPRIFDWLHHNFSHHTEHHLFPHMSSDYYPLVRRILRERYPDRYNCLSYGEALRRLWQSDAFVHPPQPSTPTEQAKRELAATAG